MLVDDTDHGLDVVGDVLYPVGDRGGPGVLVMVLGDLAVGLGHRSEELVTDPWIEDEPDSQTYQDQHRGCGGGHIPDLVDHGITGPGRIARRTCVPRRRYRWHPG